VSEACHVACLYPMAVCGYEHSNETRIAVSWRSTVGTGSRAFDNPPACPRRRKLTSHAVYGVFFFAAEGPVRDLLREFFKTVPPAVYMPQLIWQQVVSGLSDSYEFQGGEISADSGLASHAMCCTRHSAWMPMIFESRRWLVLHGHARSYLR
jgi:hypothetical protein